VISPAEFARQWGGDLVRPSAEAVECLQAPEESKVFLREAGLPSSTPLRFSFRFPGGQVPKLAEVLGEDGPLEKGVARYRGLGVKVQTHVCLDEALQGAIFAVNLDPAVPTRFMNGSVPQLAESLLVFRRLYHELYSSDEGAGSGERQRRYAALMRDALERIDPEAMRASEAVWRGIVLEVETGLI
jgi:SUKH-4 immunity protein of toxin-antitoxin system